MRQGDFSYQPKVGEGLFNAVLHDRGSDVLGNRFYLFHAAAQADGVGRYVKKYDHGDSLFRGIA